MIAPSIAEHIILTGEHSSVKITEDYVGHNVDWAERIPNWRVKLRN